MKRRLSDFLLRDNSGSLTVEFVLTIPIILAALFFSYEFGRAIWAYEVVAQDVRTAVRYLSRAEGVDFSNASDPAIVAAENLAKTGQTANGGTLHYPWTASSTLDVTSAPFSDTEYNVNGNVITMTASVPMTLSLLAFVHSGTNYTLSVADTAQYIGD